MLFFRRTQLLTWYLLASYYSLTFFYIPYVFGFVKSALELFVVTRENPVNDREYVMKKSSETNDAILLSSKIYDKDDLILGFDVLSHVKTEPSIYASAVESDGLNDHDDQDEKGSIVICRVACDESHRNWTVYWINKQTYPGQVAIDSSSSGPRLYNRMKIIVSQGRHTALVKQYGMHSNPKEDTGVLEDAGILKLEKPIGLSELIATHYYTLLPGEDKESAKPIAQWQWTNNILSHTIDMQVAKGADLSLHFILLVIMNIVQRDNVFGITQSGDEI